MLAATVVLNANGYNSWLGADRVKVYNARSDVSLRARNFNAPGSVYSNAVSSTFTVSAATLDRLLALLPNENHVPGKWTSPAGFTAPNLTAPVFTGGGKSGSPFAAVWPKAGANFDISVRGVDQYWNQVSTNAVVTAAPQRPAPSRVARRPERLSPTPARC